MDLKTVRLNKRSQTREEKEHIFSLITWNLKNMIKLRGDYLLDKKDSKRDKQRHEGAYKWVHKNKLHAQKSSQQNKMRGEATRWRVKMTRACYVHA